MLPVTSRGNPPMDKHSVLEDQDRNQRQSLPERHLTSWQLEVVVAPSVRERLSWQDNLFFLLLDYSSLWTKLQKDNFVTLHGTVIILTTLPWKFVPRRSRLSCSSVEALRHHWVMCLRCNHIVIVNAKKWQNNMYLFVLFASPVMKIKIKGTFWCK